MNGLARALALAAAATIGACAGRDLSLGTNASQAQPVSAAAVSGTVLLCPPGTAHPNVCCVAAPGVQGACEEFPGSPFAACPSGKTTYPDPRECCPLDGQGACVAPPEADASPPATDGGGGGGTDGGGGGACQYVCPPGWYVPPGVDATPDPAVFCCQTQADGQPECVAHAPLPTSASCGVCACPSCVMEDGATCPCDCPPPDPSCGINHTCPVCPPGWEPPTGDPTECCRSDATGLTECFSQAGGGGSTGGGGAVDAGPPTAVDASPVPGDASVNPIGCSGSSGNPGQCACSESIGASTYGFSCDPVSAVCTCSVNGGVTSTFKFAAGSTTDPCGNPAMTFQTCGFPQ